MKFIQIKDGVSIRKDKIIMVERLEKGGSNITTENMSIESIFPYETILKLAENDAIEENIKNSLMVPMVSRGNIASSDPYAQFFAG